ncbi:MAG: AraC family transcriptional regulator [Lachnospiraceae bacterium]|nr:AraC family transcriptional regulator [Lachnospiraceae bacterium]
MNNTLFTNAYVSSRRRIYTPSVFAHSSLLHLQECGQLTAARPHVSSRSNLESYLFFLVLKGSGFLEYDGVRYEVKTGDAVFIDCRRPYSQASSEDLWTLKWCHFHGPNAAAIYRKYKERGGYAVFHPEKAGDAAGCAVFRPEKAGAAVRSTINGDVDDTCSDEGAKILQADDFGTYETILDEIYEIAGSDSYTRDMQLNFKLTELLTLLMEESWHPDREERTEAGAASGVQKKVNVLEIKAYVDAHYEQPLTLESLAKQFYFSKHYLARRFKEQFGITVTAYIQQVRITRAKELLRFTDDSVETIAAACGYENNYFSRLFHKIEGVSPGVYRRNWRGGKQSGT